MAENTKKLESLEKESPLARKRREMQEALDSIDDQRKGSRGKMESEMEYQKRTRKRDE